MWSCVVVIGAPASERDAGLGQRREQRLVQQFIAQPAVEALDEGILHGLARRDVVPVDTALVGQLRMALLVNSLPLSLTTIFGLPRSNTSRSSSRATRVPESEVSATSAKALAGAIIDGEDAEAAAIGELIRHEVERPAVVRRHRHRHRRQGPDRPLAAATATTASLSSR